MSVWTKQTMRLSIAAVGKLTQPLSPRHPDPSSKPKSEQSKRFIEKVRELGGDEAAFENG